MPSASGTGTPLRWGRDIPETRSLRPRKAISGNGAGGQAEEGRRVQLGAAGSIKGGQASPAPSPPPNAQIPVRLWLARALSPSTAFTTLLDVRRNFVKISRRKKSLKPPARAART